MSEPAPIPGTVQQSTSDQIPDTGAAALMLRTPPLPLAADRPLPSTGPLAPSVVLRDLPAAEHSDKPTAPEPPICGVAGRNLLYGEIARGGMGTVLRGRDPALGRELAVKVLLEAHRSEPRLVQRFLEEAQISGQLQHPGVVPVYELGRFEDDRPFFTMKLVKGQTLASLLDRRTSPQDELPRFLAIFEQVCQTVAYAHARGVIHRDLKPSNVMVGSFGEVQVMDWGLAKVLSAGGAPEASRESPPPEKATVIKTARSGSTQDESQAGTVLGTPAYMPPEQANGEVERIDERADVFGLGAILCEVLTGKPPYAGRNSGEVHRKAMRGDLADAFGRLDGGGADAELIALGKSCLAAERDDRPRDAGVVAAQVAAYQTGVRQRLQKAELERAAAEVRVAEERKRRRLTVGLAVAVLAFVLVGALGGLQVLRQEEQRRTELALQEAERRHDVERALEKSAELSGRARWSEARLVLEQVRDRLGDTVPEELQRRLDQALRDLDLVARLDEIRQKPSLIVVKNLITNAGWQAAVQDYATAFREAGLGQVGDEVATVAERIRASAIRGPLIAALDDWAGMVPKDQASQFDWLLAVARQADPDEWRDRFRDPKVRRDRAALERLAQEARVGELSPQAVTALGKALKQSGADPIPLLAEAQRLHPSDFWLAMTLGTNHYDAGRKGEAISYFRLALALQPQAQLVRYILGFALATNGQSDEAIGVFRSASAADPKDALAHVFRGLVLQYATQTDQAIQAYQEALRLDSRLALAHFALGVTLAAKGQLDDAISTFREALAIDFQDTFASMLRPQTHYHLGQALRDKGQLDEAIQEFRAAVRLDSKYVLAHNNLGLALTDKGQLDEAIQAFREALRLDPKFAVAHYNLGITFKAKGQLDEAIQEYRNALRLDPKYVAAHNNLGLALKAKGQLDEAIQAYLDEAIQAYREAIRFDPKYTLAYNNLGIALTDKGQLDEAIQAFREALRLDPKYAMAYYNLGITFKAKGQLDEAIQAYRDALRLDPKYTLAHNNLGLALHDKGQLEEAIQAYHEALRLDPKHVLAHNNLGWALQHLGRFHEASQEYRKALELDPKYTRARTNLHNVERLIALDEKLPAILAKKEQPADNAERLALAYFCLEQKKLPVAALHFYQEAFAADAKLAEDLGNSYRYNAACAAALAGCGQGNDTGSLDDQERARLRKQARDWLQADLALWTRRADSDQPKERAAVQRTLEHWQSDMDLAGIRDQAALEKLLEAERNDYQKLWADVAAVWKRAGEPQ